MSLSEREARQTGNALRHLPTWLTTASLSMRSRESLFQRLKEIVKEKYASASTEVVMEEFSRVMGGAKTMKGFIYAVRQSKRNARNYARRRALSGRWTNNHKTWKPY